MTITTGNGLTPRRHRGPVLKVCVAEFLCLFLCSLAIAQPSSPAGARGYAGLRSAPDNNAELLKAFGLKRGAIVSEVVQGSPAQKAGIRPDDVILAVNGTPIDGPDDLTALMSRSTIGSAVTLTIDRDGKSLDYTLTLVSAEELGDGGPRDASANPKAGSTGPKFGIAIRDLAPAERNIRHLEGDEGIEVVSVDQGSFAAKLGLQPQDIILSINRRPVRSSEDFLQTKASMPYGGAVALRVARVIAGSGGPPANPGWTTVMLSGTAPTFTESLFLAQAEGMQRSREAEAQATQQPAAVPRTPTFRERLASALGQLQYPSQGQSRGVGTAGCSGAAIAGDWQGHKLTDGILRQVDISFRFNGDGTYAYSAGQGNAAWITEQGVYEIAPGNQRYPCQLTLTPDANTVRISSPAHLFILQSTDLMDDQSRKFLYQFPRWAPTDLMLAGTWTDWPNDIGAFRLQRK